MQETINSTLKKPSRLPLSLKVKYTLRARMEKGEWPVGTQLPTLPQLVDQYGVSRATIRTALDELERAGLIERTRGRGSCVIGSNWGFVPELITNDVNGVLLPDDDDQWIATIRELKNDTERRIRYRMAAADLGQSYHISRVAPLYMKLFERALAQKKQRLAENRLW